jgi:hypothetical protein
LYPSIGREIARDIEGIFEPKVNPGTIKNGAARIECGTNVPQEAFDAKSARNDNREKLEKPAPAQGGARLG